MFSGMIWEEEEIILGVFIIGINLGFESSFYWQAS
jgi:hypothetical protein